MESSHAYSRHSKRPENSDSESSEKNQTVCDLIKKQKKKHQMFSKKLVLPKPPPKPGMKDAKAAVEESAFHVTHFI